MPAEEHLSHSAPALDRPAPVGADPGPGAAAGGPPLAREARAPSEAPPVPPDRGEIARRIAGDAVKLLGLIGVLLLATGSDLTLALYQGLLLADLTVWALTAGFELAMRKTLGALEAIGYLLVIWLFLQLGNGQWLPEDPSCLGLAFLSFLLVFLGKILWWSHRNLVVR